MFDGCGNLSEIPVKKSYEVTLVANTNGTITPVTLSVDFGKTNTFTVTPSNGYYVSSISCTNGYTVSGTTGVNATEAQTVTVSNNNQNENSTCTASFEISTYTIGYDLAGGTIEGTNPTSYTIKSDPITLLNPTRVGHNFTGWTGSNGGAAQTSLIIPTGSFGNKSYTANWQTKTYTVDIVVTRMGGAVVDKYTGEIQYGNSVVIQTIPSLGNPDTEPDRFANLCKATCIKSVTCTNGYTMDRKFICTGSIGQYESLRIYNNNSDNNTVCNVSMDYSTC